MDPEGSLPCSQQPAIGPYPESDSSVHTFQPYFPKIHSNIIFTSTPPRRPSGILLLASTN